VAASTIYDIRLRYMLEDKASKGLNTMDRRLQKTAKSTGLLRSGLGKIAALGAGAFGVRAAGKALIGYNKQMEDARTNIAGLVMSVTGADWGTAIGASSNMMGQLQDRAAKSTATTMEMVGFMNETVGPLMAAGLHAKDLAEFTADSVIAAKAFGDEGIAAMDIQQALNQGVQIRDRFSRKLLRTVKMTREEFNKLGKAERLDVLKSAVSHKSIKELGEQQSKTFSGVWSTFQDNMQRSMGQAGEGLFAAVKGQLMEWNNWLKNNQARVKDIGATVGKHLVTGFKVIKSVISFFVDHADTLILVAKAWAGFKMGKMMGGMLGGGGMAGGGMLQRLGGGLLSKGFNQTGLKVASFGATMTTIGGVVARFAGPVGMAGMALKGIYDWWKKEDPSKKKKRLEMKEAAKGMLAAQKQINPLMEKQLRTRGASGVSPFESGSNKFLGDDDIVGGNFMKQYQAFSGKEISTSAFHKQQFPGKGEDWKWSKKLQLEMKVGAQKLRELEQNLGPAQKSLAEFAMANGLFTDDMKGIDMKGKLFEMRASMDFNKDSTNLREAMRILDYQMRSGAVNIDSLLAPDKVPDALAAVPEVEVDTSTKPPKVNVTIQRIEVKSDDPDRFVFNMQSAVSKLAKNPSQSGLAQRIAGGS